MHLARARSGYSRGTPGNHRGLLLCVCCSYASKLREEVAVRTAATGAAPFAGAITGSAKLKRMHADAAELSDPGSSDGDASCGGGGGDADISCTADADSSRAGRLQPAAHPRGCTAAPWTFGGTGTHLPTPKEASGIASPSLEPATAGGRSAPPTHLSRSNSNSHGAAPNAGASAAAAAQLLRADAGGWQSGAAAAAPSAAHSSVEPQRAAMAALSGFERSPEVAERVAHMHSNGSASLGGAGHVASIGGVPRSPPSRGSPSRGSPNRGSPNQATSCMIDALIAQTVQLALFAPPQSAPAHAAGCDDPLPPPQKVARTTPPGSPQRGGPRQCGEGGRAAAPTLRSVWNGILGAGVDSGRTARQSSGDLSVDAPRSGWITGGTGHGAAEHASAAAQPDCMAIDSAPRRAAPTAVVGGVQRALQPPAPSIPCGDTRMDDCFERSVGEADSGVLSLSETWEGPSASASYSVVALSDDTAPDFCSHRSRLAFSSGANRQCFPAEACCAAVQHSVQHGAAVLCCNIVNSVAM